MVKHDLLLLKIPIDQKVQIGLIHGVNIPLWRNGEGYISWGSIVNGITLSKVPHADATPGTHLGYLTKNYGAKGLYATTNPEKYPRIEPGQVLQFGHALRNTGRSINRKLYYGLVLDFSPDLLVLLGNESTHLPSCPYPLRMCAYLRDNTEIPLPMPCEDVGTFTYYLPEGY